MCSVIQQELQPSLLRFNETDRAPIAYFENSGSLSFDFLPPSSAPLACPAWRAGKAIVDFELNMAWSDEFGEPIELPDGLTFRTLRDAATYILKLPKADQDTKERQAAMQALILVAEQDGPSMFARIGVMRALNRHVKRVFNPDRKDHHWGKRKLKRDE